MSELKPCPFCGSMNIKEDWGVVIESYHEHQDGYVECLDCGASVDVESVDGSMSSVDLINKWNARADGWISVVNHPPHSDDVLCRKDSGFCQIDYYKLGKFQLSNDYIEWMDIPK